MPINSSRSPAQSYSSQPPAYEHPPTYTQAMRTQSSAHDQPPAYSVQAPKHSSNPVNSGLSSSMTANRVNGQPTEQAMRGMRMMGGFFG